VTGGRVVRDLTNPISSVIDSGLPAPILDFYAAIRRSVSRFCSTSAADMGVGGNMDRARDAVRVVLSHLHSRGDEAALFTFDSKLQEVVPFTTDLDRIRSRSVWLAAHGA
jgi:hypothetical protein